MGNERFHIGHPYAPNEGEKGKPYRAAGARLSQEADQYNRAKRDNDVGLGGFAGETFQSLAYQGSAAWIKGAGQLLDDGGSAFGLYKGNKLADTVTDGFSLVGINKPEEATYGSKRWYAQQVGSGFGYAVPFAITHNFRSLTGLSVVARTEQTVASTGRLMSAANAIKVGDAAVTGFASDFIFRPLEGDEAKGSIADHMLQRTKHGASGAVVLGTMTATSLPLRQATRSLAAALAGPGVGNKVARGFYDVGVGMATGVPAGEASAFTNAGLDHHRLPTAEERAQARWSMAFTGGVLSLGHVVARDQKSLDQAIEQRSRKKNLGSLLDERSRAAKEGGTTDGARTEATSPEAKVTRPATGSAADALLKSEPAGTKETVKKDGREPGRTEGPDGKGPKKGSTFASADVDGKGENVQNVEIPKARAAVLQPALQSMANMAYEASRPGADAQQHAEAFQKIVQGDPAALAKVHPDLKPEDLPILEQALKQVAQGYGNAELSAF